MEESEAVPEKCLVKIMNYREPVALEASAEGAPVPSEKAQVTKDRHESKTSANAAAEGERDS